MECSNVTWLCRQYYINPLFPLSSLYLINNHILNKDTRVQTYGECGDVVRMRSGFDWSSVLFWSFAKKLCVYIALGSLVILLHNV